MFFPKYEGILTECSLAFASIIRAFTVAGVKTSREELPLLSLDNTE
jgi:hypothetical protein